MITVIPRKITATSVNGVTVANDGSITLPVDSVPTTNSTNLVTSGGVKTELDVLSARIGNAENPAQVWTDVSFTIPTSSWSLSNNKYTATVQSSSILATSGVFVNYDDLDNAITPIIAEESTGQVTFTTETIPSGTITGTFRIIDSVNGIVPLARGGTGVAATSNENLLTQLGAVNQSDMTTAKTNIEKSIAIVANGNTHDAITNGQYVYVKNHSSLTEGVYVAKSNIASNGTLSTTNLISVQSGGLNHIKEDLNNKIEILSNILVTQGAGFHNSIFRGKNLGNSVTTAQFTAISSGTFDDLFVGDYWVINGVNWRIWDLDRYYNCGDTALNKHHIIVVPDTALYDAEWDTTNTPYGYGASDIRTNIKSSTNSMSEGAQLKVIAAFGDSHVLSYRALYPDAYIDGAADGWVWTDARVELLNENEVYGAQVWSKTGYEVGISKQQLSLCRLAPWFVNISLPWWLRSVHSANDACAVDDNGQASRYPMVYLCGVRPFALIG